MVCYPNFRRQEKLVRKIYVYRVDIGDGIARYEISEESYETTPRHELSEEALSRIDKSSISGSGDNLSGLAESIKATINKMNEMIRTTNFAIDFRPPYDFEIPVRLIPRRCHPLKETEIQEFITAFR